MSCDILVKPIADKNRWTFMAMVHLPQGQGARDRVTELSCTENFVTEAEAEMEGIAFIKKWIDQGKPST